MATANAGDPGEDEPDDEFICAPCRRGRCAQCRDARCGCCAGGDPEPWPPRW